MFLLLRGDARRERRERPAQPLDGAPQVDLGRALGDAEGAGDRDERLGAEDAQQEDVALAPGELGDGLEHRVAHLGRLDGVGRGRRAPRPLEGEGLERAPFTAPAPRSIEREAPRDGGEPGAGLAADLVQVIVVADERLLADVARRLGADEARRERDDARRVSLEGRAQGGLASREVPCAQGRPSATARRT
jgi:hypothetical protein